MRFESLRLAGDDLGLRTWSVRGASLTMVKGDGSYYMICPLGFLGLGGLCKQVNKGDSSNHGAYKTLNPKPYTYKPQTFLSPLNCGEFK